MKKEEIQKFTDLFDQIRHKEITKNKTEIEFWYARDLQKLLGYEEWRNFLSAINRAKQSCETNKYKPSDHFVDANKMVAIGFNTGRAVDDIILTRYAYYLNA